MTPLQAYLVGTGSWFLGFGLQSVMFAWLVTMVLRESPQNVGVAQMALLLPGTLLILIGGSIADRHGGKTIAVAGQMLATLGPLLLVAVLVLSELTFGLMLCYAVLMGTASAFVTPGRDGLLNSVANGRVQRVVMMTSIAQFGMQMVGFALAFWADRVGPVPILVAQALVLFIGVIALSRLPRAASPVVSSAPQLGLLQSVAEGARTVFGSPAMRSVALQNIAMAVCFMGSYIVTVPLLVREVFNGSAEDLALINGFNSLGLVLTIVFLLRCGDIRRQGRALVLAQLIGSVALGASAFMPSVGLFIVLIFSWGICGGMAMTMARTIMQEQAPAAQRGRVMGFYGFTFMGAGPIGALVNGYLVDWLGPPMALLCASCAMLLIILSVSMRSALWTVTGDVYEAR